MFFRTTLNTLVVLIIFPFIAFSKPSNPSQVIFQFHDQETAYQAIRQLPARKIDFGLSLSAQGQIFRLTEGKVDFRHIYSVQADLVKDAYILRTLQGYDGLLFPNVPPPGFLTEPDPELKDQWWIDKLQIQEAWKQVSGKGITIADCDAGYHTDEPDLIPNLLLEHRYDLSDKDEPLKVNDGSYTFHGTAVAAIMSASLDGKGTNGIAHNAKIIPLQNFNYDSQDDLEKEEATARCVLRAISLPEVKIIVLENQTATGSSETFAGTREAIRLAIASGIHVVSAGGNSSVELKSEATDDTGSIIVGALRQDGTKAGFSNYGKRISVAAFGENLHTLYGPNGIMGSFGGTSGATPQVAATVALMLEANPGITPGQMRSILETTRITTAQNQDVGGFINVPDALKMAKDTRENVQSLHEQEKVRKDTIRILDVF